MSRFGLAINYIVSPFARTVPSPALIHVRFSDIIKPKFQVSKANNTEAVQISVRVNDIAMVAKKEKSMRWKTEREES